MEIEHPLWETYENRFEAAAKEVQVVSHPEPPLDRCRYYLCLYGENGMGPEEEMAMLTSIEALPTASRRKIQVETAYWQDTVLFVP